MNTPQGAVGQASMVFERTYRARIESVWALWTTKEGFESWWGSDGSRVVVHTIEPREGGRLHYDMVAVAPADVAARRDLGLPPSSSVRARFSEFRPFQRLVLAHIVDFVPRVKPYEHEIVVEFFRAGDCVRMVTSIQPMHDEAFTQTSISVFAGQLERLEARFRTL